jgi:hypothetical protein
LLFAAYGVGERNPNVQVAWRGEQKKTSAAKIAVDKTRMKGPRTGLICHASTEGSRDSENHAVPVDEVLSGVYAILDARNPGMELCAGTQLGSGGLGLDSIALVEFFSNARTASPSRWCR